MFRFFLVFSLLFALSSQGWSKDNVDVDNALIDAIYISDINGVKQALENGADVDARGRTRERSTALMAAVQMRDIDKVTLLWTLALPLTYAINAGFHH